MVRVRGMIGAAVLVLASPAVAMAIDESALSLQAAILAAEARSPLARAAGHAVEAARSREAQAALWPAPTLSFLVDQVPLPNPGAGNYMVGVGQPLPLGGARALLTRVAHWDTAIAELDRDAQRVTLAERVGHAFASLLHARATQAIAADALRDGTALRDAALKRFAAGDIARVDVLRAEVAVAGDRREVAKANVAEARARGTLNLLVGNAPEASLRPAAWPVPLDWTPPPAEVLRSRALQARADIRRAEAVAQREGLSGALVLASRWAGAELSLHGGAVAGQPGFSTALSLPGPFRRLDHEQSAAEAERLVAEARLAAFVDEVTIEVTGARLQVFLAQQQLSLLTTQDLPQAERLLENARRRFSAGEGSGFEVLEARRGREGVRHAHAQAVLAYHEALVELAAAVGLDPAGLATQGSSS